jgi:protein gp37
MASNSPIEWTGATWNPVTGCDKVSPGCAHCYAERMAKRLQAMGQRNYAKGFELTPQEHMLELPLRWRRPKRVFVNSMSDLFHADVPFEFIQQAFDVMRRANWHQYQVLTKRSERLLSLDSQLDWQPHIWMGVSVENERFQRRIDDLRTTHAQVKFLSIEPLLGPLPRLNLRNIDWVIVGGESGPHARPMDPSWVLDIRDQCRDAEVSFFFKQWGGVLKSRTGRELEGRTWNQMPDEPRMSWALRPVEPQSGGVVARRDANCSPGSFRARFRTSPSPICSPS